jgi:hypothetical protein
VLPRETPPPFYDLPDLSSLKTIGLLDQNSPYWKSTLPGNDLRREQAMIITLWYRVGPKPGNQGQ